MRTKFSSDHGLRDQLQHAGVSIASNSSEGLEKGTDKEAMRLPNAKCLILVIGLGLLAWQSRAHESRPLYIEIIELEGERLKLQYKIPLTIPDFNLPTVAMGERFEPVDQEVVYQLGDGVLKRQTLRFEGSINEQTVTISYPVINPSVSSIISVTLLNGQQFNKVLGPEELVWKIPAQESFVLVARQYTTLGIQHILEGWDHLLFLVCLVLVAGTGRKMLITITGFTFAHSITLVLSTLGLVSLPIPPVEAVIALSVVFLASEIALKDEQSLTYRYPITVSSSFGLLHGFGFASVLSDIGLPQTQVPVSLLFFNVGVEVGQLIFLFAMIILIKVLGRLQHFHVLPVVDRLKAERWVAYGAGSMASFWLIDRLVGFF